MPFVAKFKNSEVSACVRTASYPIFIAVIVVISLISPKYSYSGRDPYPVYTGIYGTKYWYTVGHPIKNTQRCNAVITEHLRIYNTITWQKDRQLFCPTKCRVKNCRKRIWYLDLHL